MTGMNDIVKDRGPISVGSPEQDKIIVHYTMANKNEKLVINNIKNRIVMLDHIRKLCGSTKGFFFFLFLP